MSQVQEPKASRTPHLDRHHGHERIDYYHWLRDMENHREDIMKYLQDENNHTNLIMSQHEEVKKEILQEIISRITLQSQTPPYLDGDYSYYKKIEENQNYWVWYRKNIITDREEIILDQNELAKEQKYFSLGTGRISTDHRFLAYSTDVEGNERYNIFIKDLFKQQTLKDFITNTIGEIVWDSQANGFFYTTVNEKWRSKEVKFHFLNGDPLQDQTIYLENDLKDGSDSTFSVSIRRSNDGTILFIDVESKDITEVYCLFLNDERRNLYKIISRNSKCKYKIEHHNNIFYGLTNDKGNNFRLVGVKLQKIIQNSENSFLVDQWQKAEEFLPHDSNNYLLDIHCYQNNIVITSKVLGLKQLSIYQLTSEGLLSNRKVTKLKFPQVSYDLDLVFTTYNSNYLRYKYSSLTSPLTFYQVSFTNQERTEMLHQDYSGDIKPDDYVVERIMVKSRDGLVDIPVSILRKKDVKGKSPLLLYGYGSYGISVPTSFRPHIFSLINRGFSYAIAHIRGGDDLGRSWYESAKFLNKKKTFFDFIDVAQFLVKNNYTSHDQMVLHGGSAGGMLVGAVINVENRICKTVIADVPFVDVLNTMLDESLPLTPGEFDEWGNPGKYPDYYHYILSYSPYDNIKSTSYPNILVTAGLSDPRVTYWEPAKWVAKLRHDKTNDSLILLKTNMSSGHSGSSGRFAQYEEVAFIYTFILKTLYMLKN